MGYASSVIGGAASLIRAAIKSPNYVTGSTGWTINKDGTAEFNGAIFRGTVTVIGPNGAKVIIKASATYPTVQFTNTSGTVIAEMLLANNTTLQLVGITFTPADGFARHGTLVVSDVQLISAIVDDTLGTVFGGFTDLRYNSATVGYNKSSTGLDSRVQVNDTGIVTIRGQSAVPSTSANTTIITVNPGGNIAVDHPVILDSAWTSLLASYPAGWTTTAAFNDLAYRADATGRVWFRGNVQVAAANAAGVKFTMPAGWRPPIHCLAMVPAAIAGASDFTIFKKFDVSTAGAFNMQVASGAAIINLDWTGVSYSLL